MYFNYTKELEAVVSKYFLLPSSILLKALHRKAQAGTGVGGRGGGGKEQHYRLLIISPHK